MSVNVQGLAYTSTILAEAKLVEKAVGNLGLKGNDLVKWVIDKMGLVTKRSDSITLS
jgi:hypothetical protein